MTPVDPNPSDVPAVPPRVLWRDRLFRPRTLIALALLLSLPVLGPWLWRQLPELHSQPEYQLSFDQIQLEPQLPADLPAGFLQQVRERAQLESSLSVLDPELPRILAEAFAQHPWIAQVVSVRNLYPATVSVEVVYRRPVAMISVDTGYYAVDARGVLLPPADFDSSALQRYVPVRGVRTRPRGPAGTEWGDPVVTGAATLAEFLGPRWQAFELSAIEVAAETAVPRADEEPRYELVTRGGTRILWGRPPGSQHPGELAASQKLGRLEKYLAEFGSFERPRGPYEIDIRHWQEISRRPLENPYANTARGGATHPQR